MELFISVSLTNSVQLNCTNGRWTNVDGSSFSVIKGSSGSDQTEQSGFLKRNGGKVEIHSCTRAFTVHGGSFPDLRR